MKTACWMMLGMLLTSALGSAQDSKPATTTPPPPPPTGLPPLPSAFTTPAPRRSNIPQTPVATTPAVTVPPTAIPSAPSPLQPVQPVQVVPAQRGLPSAFPSVAPGQAPGQLTALKWDSEQKEYTSKKGEVEARFSFWLTNITSSDVSINTVRTSCGCTVAKLPSTPWVVPPNGSGPIDVTVNLAGKFGTITKAVTVESSAGTKSLLVKVNIDGGAMPGQPLARSNMNDADRLKNMQQALADRQVVFKNQECAKCHAEPGLTAMTDGRQIYNSTCGVCHESHIRASMVPDLKTLTHPTDAEYWRNWINYGRAGSMMPAFAQAEGGPLSESQVNALVTFLVQAYPSRQGPVTGTLQKSAAVRPAPASVVSPPVVVPTR